jgi:hypothetical protein
MIKSEYIDQHKSSLSVRKQQTCIVGRIRVHAFFTSVWDLAIISTIQYM